MDATSARQRSHKLDQRGFIGSRCDRNQLGTGGGQGFGDLRRQTEVPHRQCRLGDAGIRGAGQIIVGAAVLAHAGLTIASEWMFTPELRSGAVRAVLSEWSLPPLDLWATARAGPILG